MASTALGLAAFALAVVLRLRQASAPLSFDEYASLYFSSRPFGDLWGWWMLRETNPPLFYTVLKLWRGLVPDTEGGLRLLPLLLSLGQIAILARFIDRTYGRLAAVLGIVLFALSPSDIFQSEYLRGYVFAKLAVTISFVGLVTALEDRPRAASGWLLYVGGAVMAIYAHTTMVLWPMVAGMAVLADAAISRRNIGSDLRRLALATIAIAALSFWVLWIAVVQLHARSGNIGWIEPLSFEDYVSSANLQLLLAGGLNSALMLGLMAIGTVRTLHRRVTRLCALITLATLAGFKLADRVHPIVSDYTLHWAMVFTVIPGAAALTDLPRRFLTPMWRKATAIGLATLVIGGIIWEGVDELVNDVYMVEPQDWRYTITTVADTPGAALLVSHESIGVVVEQACRLRFGSRKCPFRLIVLANRARSDSWATGGYGGAMVSPDDARKALGEARAVFAFSRYVYTPLDQLGIDAGRYRHVQWDDGELIGPIKPSDFAPRR